MTAARLSTALFGDEEHCVTVRAEVSRLRRVIGGLVTTNPYRLADGVSSPFSAPTSAERRAIGCHHGAVLLADVLAASAAVAGDPVPHGEGRAPSRTLLRRADADEVEPVTAWLAGETRQGRLGVGWRTPVPAGRRRPPPRRR